MTVAETLQQEVDPPVVIHETPVPDQLWAGLRQMLPLITAYLVFKGYISGELEQIIAASAGIVMPIVWGQLKTRLRAIQLAAVEKQVSDSILTTKTKAVA